MLYTNFEFTKFDVLYSYYYIVITITKFDLLHSYYYFLEFYIVIIRVCILNTVRWIHAYKKLRMSLALRAKWNRISILNERTISISQASPGIQYRIINERTILISQGILVRVSNASKVFNSEIQFNSPQKVIYNHNSKFTNNFETFPRNLQRPLKLLGVIHFLPCISGRDIFPGLWNISH